MTGLKNKILLCAGGTGGHVFPAIATAEALIARGYRVHFITDSRAKKFFKNTSFDYDVVSSGTYQAGLWGKVKFLWPFVRGFFESLKIINSIKPYAAIGFGGYPTVPPLLACTLLRVNFAVHESNAILGLANDLLAPFTKKILTTHEKTNGIRDWFRRKIKYTGNPVRAEIVALKDAEFPSIENGFNIMVVGGSLGAKIFSNLVVESICALPSEFRAKIFITQQSRAEDIERVKKLYEDAGIKFEIQEFYADMPQRLRQTHFLIARAGAGTVTELTMAGRPAIYIPYPYNRDRQQYFNAAEVEKAEGGWVMDELTLTSDALKTQLIQLLQNPEGLAQYGANARGLARPDAAAALANLMIEKIGFTS
jgi:UDP-N-acetylglucosamine--N-acetylmuramyl-(pentapeptide) pyrophosphoryl-undecaprenol N-acetylglucosamine transferase